MHTEQCATVGHTVENENWVGAVRQRVGDNIQEGDYTEGGKGNSLEPYRPLLCWLKGAMVNKPWTYLPCKGLKHPEVEAQVY